MLLYCISIFLENKKRESFLKTCIHNGITYTKIEITDQTNEKGYGYQVNINGLKILLLPCNDFHKDKDFELGLTMENKENWDEFIHNIKTKFENNCGTFVDDKTEYFVFKNKQYHGNFFFIYDGQKSQEEPLLQLHCRMTKYDFDFYKTELESLLGKNITGKINVISDTKFEVNTLFIKNGNTDLVIEL
ncbi:MAG: hypothetical protein K6E51_05335 [Treponema sp.]|nr:hypothetical protein [Treponema sp.]